jgi:AcrR family transcriptional regulator
VATEDPTQPAPAPDSHWALGLSREVINRLVHHLREVHSLDVRPEEGLRERKKRLTRQQISDTATWMFCERGFDNVRVAEVAAEVGVSEKTVYNYFPTKESLVFDREDELKQGIRDALTAREPGTSPTDAIVEFIEREVSDLSLVDDEILPLFKLFRTMIRTTPALRAAQQELNGKLIDVATEALAESAQVDPRDPEPRVAAHALIALWEVQMSSRERHIEAGLTAAEAQRAVMDDVRRAARLLDTGLWSFNSIVQGAKTRSQVSEAAKVANEARKQVMDALRQARDAWSEVRRAHEEAHSAADGSWFERHAAGEAAEQERRDDIRARRRAQAEERRAAAIAQREAHRAQAEAERAKAIAHRARAEAGAQRARAEAEHVRAAGRRRPTG